LPVWCRVVLPPSVSCLCASQPGPGTSRPDDWYGLKAQAGRGQKKIKRSTWVWSVYLKSGVHKRLLGELGVNQQGEELWFGQVEIYKDCHPEEQAKQLVYRVAALRYGSVQSLQQLCDWWGSQRKPKNPDEVRRWLCRNKVSGRVCSMFHLCSAHVWCWACPPPDAVTVPPSLLRACYHAVNSQQSVHLALLVATCPVLLILMVCTCFDHCRRDLHLHTRQTTHAEWAKM
jgi:hypothetical protein